MQTFTAEEVEREETEKYKACLGCKHRFKEENVSIRFSRFKWTEVDKVYGCGFGQLNMTLDLSKLPEQCRLRNMKADKETYRPFVVKKERDNCRTCMVYMDQKTICKGERKVLVCPCKTCEDFMVNEKGCMNLKEECGKKVQYEVIKEG